MNENNEQQKLYHCNICIKDYASHSSLCNHNKKYHKINIKKCINTVPICNAIVTNFNNDNIKCRKCEKVFNNRQTKWRHEKECTNIKINNDLFNEKLEDFKNTIIQILTKNQSTINDKKINTMNIEPDNKIIKSDDNKFQFDFNKNFLTFHDKPIKYFYHNDQVYFKGKDIASMLDYKNKNQAIINNVDIEDRIIIGKLLMDPVWETGSLKSDIFRGVCRTDPPKNISLLENEDPQTVFINESGFYSIILASKKDEAKKFKRWVTSIVLPSIRKTGSYSLIDNYIEEDLDKYYNKDCVYIIHIKDNIYKYGNTSHLFKRLQAHKTNLNYNKIIKIYDMNNMNDAIKLENKIKTLVKTLKINTVYNTHIEIFEVDNNNLQNLIKKIDELSFKIINTKNNENIKNLDIEKEKTKQLELENENLKLKLELFKLSK
uniref:Bro-N domain-containing protein n=1 Tax=viral metagenome TaxID=1070528 RepID=A0A6C0EFP7_9ZZZZ